MERLIADNKSDVGVSLAVFKPTCIVDFTIESTERSWDPERLKAIEARSQQLNLFGGEESPFTLVRKLPFVFRYEFEDVRGRSSTLMIEDWEIGSLFWNCLEHAEGDENAGWSSSMRDRSRDRENLRRENNWPAHSPAPP